LNTKQKYQELRKSVVSTGTIDSEEKQKKTSTIQDMKVGVVKPGKSRLFLL